MQSKYRKLRHYEENPGDLLRLAVVLFLIGVGLWLVVMFASDPESNTFLSVLFR